MVFAVSACRFLGGNQTTPAGYVRHCVRLLDREALYADSLPWQQAKKTILSDAKTFTTMDQAHDAVSRAANVAGGVILDLRGNTGGDMGPMIASVSPPAAEWVEAT